MALTESNMMKLGTLAPHFLLRDALSNAQVSFNEIRGKNGTLVIFMCNHCPYVIHVLPEMIRIVNDYNEMGIKSVAISSNDVEKYPDDSAEKMAKLARENSFVMPYLYDEDQSVAKAYEAACTPDFYLFNEMNELVYRGRMDRSRPGNSYPNDGGDLRRALDQLLAGEPISDQQYPSAGCNIKWK